MNMKGCEKVLKIKNLLTLFPGFQVLIIPPFLAFNVKPNEGFLLAPPVTEKKKKKKKKKKTKVCQNLR